MVFDTTKTGLIPIEKAIFIKRKNNSKKKVVLPKLNFQECIQPAPVTAKPFATLCNPFRKGCSIFCNHPNSNADLKMAIKKSKMKKEEETEEYGVDKKALAERVGEVLEEMLSRYRQTPTPGSSPIEGTPPPPRAVLVLDLRRTASQETLSTTAGGPGTSGGFQSSIMSPSQSSLSMPIRSVTKTPQSPVNDALPEPEQEIDQDEDNDQKRRGKVKKKKKKNLSNVENEKSGKEVIGLEEPGETQISAFNENDEISWHGSVSATPQPSTEPIGTGIRVSYLLSDIFDHRTLRHLRRSLTVEQAEGEFRRVWRKVLKEALSASDSAPENDMKPEIKDEIDIPLCQPEKWLSYPRKFNYSSARFDIPIDKSELNKLSSLEYLREYVAASKETRLLYNHVFDKYKMQDEKRLVMEGKVLLEALGVMMGREFTDSEVSRLKELTDFDDETIIDLRTWTGLCCLCERVFGLQFSSGDYPNLGERAVLEQVDFDLLNQELPDLSPHPKLLELLCAVQHLPDPPVRKEIETPEDPTPEGSIHDTK